MDSYIVREENIFFEPTIAGEMMTGEDIQDANLKLALTCVLFLFLLVSWCLNGIAIIVIVTNKKLQTSTNYYELSTFIFILITLSGFGWLFPLQFVNPILSPSTFERSNEAVLKSLNVFVVLHETTKIIERYFGLSQPLHTRAKSLKTRSIRLIIFIWVITMVVCLPFIMCNNMQDSVIRGHNDVEPTFKNAFPAGMLSDSNHQRAFTKQEHLNQTAVTSEQVSIKVNTTTSSKLPVSRHFTYTVVCSTYKHLSPYLDFLFLYFMPLLLNAIFFGITVRQLRHVCEDGRGSNTWKLSKVTGLKYKQQKCRAIAISEVASTYNPQSSFKNLPSINVQESETCPQHGSKNCLRHQVYTMIFPSITFLTQTCEIQGIIEPSQTSNCAAELNDRFQKHPIAKRISSESAASCMTAMSALSDESQAATMTAKPTLMPMRSVTYHTKKPPMTRMSSQETDVQKNLKPTRLWKKRIRAVKNLSFAMLIFFIKWLPYHTVRIYIAQNIPTCVNGPCHYGSKLSDNVLEYLKFGSGYFIFIVTIASPLLLCVCSSPFHKEVIRFITCGKYAFKNSRRHSEIMQSSGRGLGTTCDR